MMKQQYKKARHDISNSLTTIQRMSALIRPYTITMANYFKENKVGNFSDRQLELIALSFNVIEEETIKLEKLFNELCND